MEDIEASQSVLFTGAPSSSSAVIFPQNLDLCVQDESEGHNQAELEAESCVVNGERPVEAEPLQAEEYLPERVDVRFEDIQPPKPDEVSQTEDAESETQSLTDLNSDNDSARTFVEVKSESGQPRQQSPFLIPKIETCDIEDLPVRHAPRGSEQLPALSEEASDLEDTTSPEEGPLAQGSWRVTQESLARESLNAHNEGIQFMQDTYSRNSSHTESDDEGPLAQGSHALAPQEDFNGEILNRSDIENYEAAQAGYDSDTESSDESSDEDSLGSQRTNQVQRSLDAKPDNSIKFDKVPRLELNFPASDAHELQPEDKGHLHLSLEAEVDEVDMAPLAKGSHRLIAAPLKLLPDSQSPDEVLQIARAGLRFGGFTSRSDPGLPSITQAITTACNFCKIFRTF